MAASSSVDRPQMIQRRFVLGVQHDVKDGCQFIDENTVVWTAGKNIVVYNTQYATQKFISCSDTCEAITALAVSSNRRSLAVAEMSETPAIAIYDPQTRRRKRFLQVPDIGSREYVCLAFSADGRYLAAQGGFPEWNLVLWSVDKTKAVAMVPANDKTNPSQDRRLINQCSISPKDPTVMCVSGNGIFKFFKYQDNQLRQLAGGLGKSEPMNYLAHVWLPPDDRIIVSTDNGDLLLVENFEYRHQLPLSPSDGISIDTLVAHGTKGFICGGDMGTISIFEKSEDKELFRRVKTHNVGAERKDTDSLVTTDDTVRILGFSITPPPSDECISILTSNRQVYVLNLSQADYSKAEDRICDVICQPFHAAAITGLDICIRKPLLVTCGKDRNVILWNYVTNTAEVTKHFSTEVLSVAIHPSGLHLLVGFPDKLRFMNVYGDDIREFRSFSIRARSVPSSQPAKSSFRPSACERQAALQLRRSCSSCTWSR
jgi:WD40 repeat protein